MAADFADREELRDQRLPSADAATELANAREVLAADGNRILYNDSIGRFMWFDGWRWVADVEGNVSQAVKRAALTTKRRLDAAGLNPSDVSRHVRRMQSAAGVRGVMELIRTEPGVTKTADDFDRDPMLLNTPGTTLNLATDAEYTNDPKDLITHVTADICGSHKRCTLWLDFLDKAMEGDAEMIAYLQRLAGLALTGRIDVQEFPVLWGEGGTGKTTFFEAIMGAMGTYAAVGTDNLLIQKPSSDHPAELAGLRGKRLVVVNETDENARLKIQTVKRLTGDSTVKARVMRGDPFEFRRTFKPWLVTNNKPVINENSEAIWRRVRLIPFTMKLADAAKDATLPERLKKEYANILAWAVKGCQAWLERGMSPPSKVLVATSTYRDNSDTFSDVVERCFVIGDVGKVKVSRRDSYAAYLADASSMAVKWPLSDRALFERLRALPGVSEDEWKDHGQKIRGFRGIGLLHPSASRPAPLPDPELEAAL